ncbi:hypothetical protein [Zhongshania borealis]|uniref:Uncharacterized protein n=1 Tax=Zhongshania borealis TaxID=889488 RepID=A0ABP7W686_9GAMM
MNITQKLLAETVRRFGSKRGEWPLWRRFFLSLFIAFNHSCRQDWLAVQREVNPADTEFLQRYSGGLEEIAVSDGLQRRLQAIAARPQQGVTQSRLPLEATKHIPFWQLSFASAMASAILGVAIGAGGYVDEFSDPDVSYMEISMAYDVSDWLAEGSQ